MVGPEDAPSVGLNLIPLPTESRARQRGRSGASEGSLAISFRLVPIELGRSRSSAGLLFSHVREQQMTVWRKRCRVFISYGVWGCHTLPKTILTNCRHATFLVKLFCKPSSHVDAQNFSEHIVSINGYTSVDKIVMKEEKKKKKKRGKQEEKERKKE
ncbi:hypothetical protein PoB_007672600 [Plakobranchus ocellatus]|uniref:Uncharacterized protein n=1 Tax=Plakobranchus ocellatus TaxID=259542 RepID=A0AAV4E2B1_9GAST|nr:hypothetical protein PoB_007672600 [Plakobranchus ocellatus]